MASRRLLVAIVLLAAALHAIGMARAILPAQDGLKFIRIAREFQTRPWIDVVRGADQHPLYPALVAVAEPLVSPFLGEGPETWRVAAQSVSAIAAVALLFPLFGLTRALFDERIATLAVLIYVLLPLPGEVGHDTLSDSLALLGFVVGAPPGRDGPAFPGMARVGGLRARGGPGIPGASGGPGRPRGGLPRRRRCKGGAPRWQGCFLVEAGPLTRPPGTLSRGRGEWESAVWRTVGKLAALAVPFLATVGGYALIKGEVSEKLALRQGVGLAARAPTIRPGGHPLPAGLDDPRWDFSPKEESEEPSSTSAAVGAAAPGLAVGRRARRGLRLLRGVGIRARSIHPGPPRRRGRIRHAPDDGRGDGG